MPRLALYKAHSLIHTTVCNQPDSMLEKDTRKNSAKKQYKRVSDIIEEIDRRGLRDVYGDDDTI